MLLYSLMVLNRTSGLTKITVLISNHDSVVGKAVIIERMRATL